MDRIYCIGLLPVAAGRAAISMRINTDTEPFLTPVNTPAHKQKFLGSFLQKERLSSHALPKS
jgi:hypothetical protein